MKKRRKWPYIIGIIVLLVPLLFLYNAYNGNPISKALAKKTLNKYLEKTYPDDEFRIWDGFYNFKFGEYVYEVSIIGDEAQVKHEFYIGGLFSNEVIYDALHDANLDKILMKKLQKEAERELIVLLKETVPELRRVTVMLEVLKGTYELDTKWDKKMELDQPMHLHMLIHDVSLSKQAFYEAAQFIQTTLNEENYNYEFIEIDGNTTNEAGDIVRYYVVFNKHDEVKINNIVETIDD